ncbi:MAG: protease modulator HflC [Gammaproteobacteria bacterium]|nr:protease modulator HflC [Gammaproteobacteria bacterium]NND39001.1 protease modulator HflC [Pseudomonadales bacterium]MBT8152153.1 protease modulator HflC [Gammaproteobacteria bacterium]NNL11448.1 protease modulator HflC [Pseudomonadales bacterium]NNM11989.1 protease modulator HflC [Pseudomonadales bacterium]
MSNRFSSMALIVALLLLVLSSSLYRIMETQTAVKLRFGELVESGIAPGLHWKFPLADVIRKVDKRLLTLDAPPSSFYTLEKKRLEVDSFVKWRVHDVGTFYKATGGDETRATALLANRVNDNLRNEIGSRTLHEVVSGERDQMILNLTAGLDKSARGELGVEIIDVRIKRIDFPQEVRSAVFERMRADREKEARQYRSEGLELAEKIRADADREKVVIEAEAYREAEETRGAGDAKAAAIYAKAYSKDAEFYAFLRRLNAYQASFSNKGDIMLIDPKSDFFRYLKSVDGK